MMITVMHIVLTFTLVLDAGSQRWHGCKVLHQHKLNIQVLPGTK